MSVVAAIHFRTCATAKSMRASHPHRVRPPLGRRRRRLLRPVVFTVLALLAVTLMYHLYASLYAWGFTAGDVPSTPRTADSPLAERLNALPTARSVAAIREICAAQAPELAHAPWMDGLSVLRRAESTAEVRRAAQERLFVVRPPPPANKIHYGVAPHPVCIDRDTGIFYASKEDRALYSAKSPVARWLYPAHAHPDLWETLEDVLPASDPSSAAASSESLTFTVVPALGVVGFGRFIATHMWHLLRDSMEAVITTFNAYEGGAIWRLPRQAMLLDEKATRWLDRNGDTPLKMAVSAAMFNIFSSFPGDAQGLAEGAGGVAARQSTNVSVPLMPTSLVAHGLPEQELRAIFRAQQRAKNGLSALLFQSQNTALVPTAPICFCQAFMARNAPTPAGASLRPLDELVQDRVARQFGAPPYRSLSQESVWAIERQRVERYPPWARQFWPSSGTSSDYQPRVLFIHRARRTIANVSTYVTAMREMGFRVEEVYLERLPTEQQYYLGRYADVVVGMHGLGVGHALWMNRYPTGCRTVIEFRLWAARHAPVRLQRTLGGHLKFHYLPIWPDDVVFGPTVKDPLLERETLIKMGHEAFKSPGWDDQEAVFDTSEVLRVFHHTMAHLTECLSLSSQPT